MRLTLNNNAKPNGKTSKEIRRVVSANVGDSMKGNAVQ